MNPAELEGASATKPKALKSPDQMDIFEAVEAGQQARVKELIGKRATINRKTDAYKTPLQIAEELEHEEIVSIIKGAI